MGTGIVDPEAPGKSKAADEERIRWFLDDRAKALCPKDVHGATSGYAPDVLTFDIAPPLHHQGVKK